MFSSFFSTNLPPRANISPYSTLITPLTKIQNEKLFFYNFQFQVFEKDGEDYIISLLDDSHFRLRSYAAASILNETGSDKMLMKSFVQAYAHRFNEILTEKGTFDMRHAVKITFINGVKIVNMTPLMKLLMRIGVLLERETYLNIFEIKEALDLPVSFCFEMGEFLTHDKLFALFTNVDFLQAIQTFRR